MPLTDTTLTQEEGFACKGADIAAEIAAVPSGDQKALQAAQAKQTAHSAEVQKTRAANAEKLREAMAECREKIRESCKDDLSKEDQHAASEVRKACGKGRDVVSRFISEKILDGANLGTVAGLAGLAAAGLGALALMNKGGSGSNVTGASSPSYSGGATSPTPSASPGSASALKVSNLDAPKAGTTTNPPSVAIGQKGVSASSSESFHQASSWTQGTGGSFVGDNGTYDPNNKGGHLRKPEMGMGSGGGSSGGGGGGSGRGLASGGAGGTPTKNDGAGGQIPTDDVNLAGGIASAKALTGLKGGSDALDDLGLAKGDAAKQPALDDLSGMVGGPGGPKGEVAGAKGDAAANSESIFVRVRKKYGTVSKRFLVSP